MSKFLKRIGTTASKFMVEMYLTKVELNLVQQCRVSIILKRGDHVVETKNAVALEKGIAKFEEKLVIPTTLYQDKKKKEYMKKEATLSIQVTTPKATRLAGVSKLDLAYYPNNNQNETEVIHQMEKCFDKNAKIHFKLRMVKVTDLIADKKSGKKDEKKDAKKAAKEEEDSKDNEKDLSGSDLPSRINAGSSGMDDFTDNSSIPDFSNFHGLKSSNGALEFGKKTPPDLDLSDDDGKSRGRTMDALRMQRDGSEDKILKSKFEPALSEITTEVYGGTSQKITELEVKVKNYQRENKELYEKIREDNEEYLNLNQDYEDLKLKYDRLQKEFDNVLNDKKIDKSTFTGLDRKTENDLKASKEKVAYLEKEVRDLTAERDEANERAEELTQATQDLLAKIETLKSKDKKGGVKDSSESMEDYIVKINELSQKLRDAEKKIREMSSPTKPTNNLSKFEVDEHELENKLLKSQLEEKINRIEELESQISIKTNELQVMKKMNMTASSKNKEEANHQMLAQIDQMEQKQKALEETYKKRIEELMKQNTQLKKDLEEARSQLNNNDFDNDSELAKLSIENESLKKQIKEMQGKMLNVKYDNKDIDDMRRKLKELENDKEKVDSELLKAKMGWASADSEKEELKAKLRDKESNNFTDVEKVEEMEKEMFKLKSKFADLMNAVMEYGDEQLLDDMEQIVSAPDEEETAGGRKTNQWVKLK